MAIDIVEQVRAAVAESNRRDAETFEALVNDVARGALTDPRDIRLSLTSCNRTADDLGRELAKLREMRDYAAVIKTIPGLEAQREEASAACSAWREEWKAAYAAHSARFHDESATPEERARAGAEMARMRDTEMHDYRTVGNPLREIVQRLDRANVAWPRLLAAVPAALRDAFNAANGSYMRAEARVKEARSFSALHLGGQSVFARRRFLVERMELPHIRTDENRYDTARNDLRDFERRLADYERLPELERAVASATEALEAARQAVIDYPDQYGAI